MLLLQAIIHRKKRMLLGLCKFLQVQSINLTNLGIGMMAGPLLGSVLYAIGGFQLPFYVTGACLFLLTILTFFTLPDSENYAPDMRWSPNSGVMKKNELTYTECLSNIVRTF